MTAVPSERAEQPDPDPEIGSPLAELRWSAGLGYLPNLAGDPEIAKAAYAIVLPLTFERHTRPLERRRGHHGCARSFAEMPAECLDRFHDDVLAVRDHLLRRSAKPVRNLEGWIVGSLGTAVVDGYRARRGLVGASQKANVPPKLAAALDDEWLAALAKLMLVWVGVPTTAGTGVWPTEAWAELRARHTGEARDYDPAQVARDVEHVTEIMKTYDATWTDRYVEQPLRYKQFPVAAEPADFRERPTAVDATEELLQDAAAMTVESVRVALAAGDDPEVVARRSLQAFRCVCVAGCDGVEQVPHVGSGDLDEVASVALTPERIELLVPVVLEIVRSLEEARVDRAGSDVPGGVAQ